MIWVRAGDKPSNYLCSGVACDKPSHGCHEIQALRLGQQKSGIGTLLTPDGVTQIAAKHLQDGHWVLSFPDADAAATAKVWHFFRGSVSHL